MKVIVIGAGPSLDRNLFDFKLHGGEFMDDTIIATDAALVACLKMRIIPKYVATLEDYPTYTKFFDQDIVRKYHDQLTAFVSGKTSSEIKTLLQQLEIQMEYPKLKYEDVICNVGLFAYLIAAQYIKADEIFLIGMDHSYGRGEHPNITEDTEIWRRAFFTTMNPHLKERMIMNPLFKLWREEFLRNRMTNPEVKVVNMTGWGVLFGRDIEWIPELI